MRVCRHVAEVGSSAKVIVQGFPTLPTYPFVVGSQTMHPFVK